MVHVQLCFLMDCTASMQPWVDAARDEIQTIIEATHQTYPDAEFEVAFVGYRDFGDTTPHVVLPFTRNIDVLREQIRRVHAVGGWDVAEDVAGGLRNAVELFPNSPRTGVRHIVHIADAPAHGLRFHAPSIPDRYPNGGPDGNEPLRWIREMSRKEVDYTILRINDSIDTMIDVFHTSYSASQATFRVLDLQTEQRTTTRPPGDASTISVLSPMVSRAVTDSIIGWSSSQDPAEE
jgi:Mg-chelatase subunit ChlD